MANEKQEAELVLGRGEVEVMEMTPWEQHSAVISIPRFDYNAPSSLLHHSHTGFLITCPIKREKSATKEVISILAKFVGSLSSCPADCFEASGANSALKKRKIGFKEVSTENDSGAEKRDIVDCGKVSKESCSSTLKMEPNVEKGPLSLVKLNRSGLLLLAFPRNNSVDSTDIVSNIFHSVDSRNLTPLNWCHRIFPIQATCRLNEDDLRPVVAKLVQQYLDNRKKKDERPKKFAVGYNRRGMDETDGKSQKSNSKDSSSSAILDRAKCFALVATVIKETITDSVVDLKSPEFAVFIELLPLAGIPNGSFVVGVSVLPQNLIISKPKLSIKALTSDTKTKNGKN